MAKKKYTRKIDNLGRIVIPMDMRKALEITEWDDLCLSLSGNHIVVEKERPECTFCGSPADLVPYKDKFICSRC